MKTEKDNLILIIDNDKAILENTSELLKLAGYSTLMAENGSAGIALAKENKPDLIICDIRMPEIDGYGVLKVIENIPEISSTPVIYMTAYSDEENFRHAMDAGADDYLIKPFNKIDLLNVVTFRIKRNKLIKNSGNNIVNLKTIINGLSDTEHIEKLFGTQNSIRLRSSEFVYKEGDPPNYLYHILSGKVRIFKTNEFGKEYITELKNKGDTFGYVTLIEQDKYKESAMTIEDSTVLLLPKKDFYQILQSDSEVSMSFIKLITSNLQDAEERLIKQAYDSGRKKTAEAIVLLHNKYAQNGGVLKIIRENIAAIAGVSPETISRNMTNFKEEGLVESGSDGIKIINLERLKKVKN